MSSAYIDPSLSAETLYVRARASFDLGQISAAVDLLQAAVRAKPSFIEAHRTLANVLLAAKRGEEALVAYQHLVDIDSRSARNHHELGILLFRSRRYADAAQSLQRALLHDPSLMDARLMIANALFHTGAFEAAARQLEHARKLRPQSGDIEGLLFLVQQHMCAWGGIDERLDALEQAAEKADGLLHPAHALIVPRFDGLALRKIAECFARRIDRAAVPKEPVSNRSFQGPVRIGYISADFQLHHPVGRHILEVIKQHDRSKFEVIGYSLKAQHTKNAVFEHSFDSMRFIDGETDREAASLIREDGIELLIDLGGYTSEARPQILAYRPAPVQINYLGYSGTMGTGFVDYLIADPITVPSESTEFYSESLAYLPETTLNGAYARPADGTITRAQVGLAENSFVFCGFCASYKITDCIFDVWMNLLREVPRSVLWLRDTNPYMRSNLQCAAANRSVSPDRLVFAQTCSTGKHLARLACADLFLDTPRYNAGSTAADALWAGLPVLTCLGNTFTSRMGASIVKAAGLSELVVADLGEYYAKALELAYDRTQLEEYRTRLIATRNSSTLFDSALFTLRLEKLYEEMSRRNRLGEPPSVILKIT